jgi:hypothetical protein
MSDTRKVFILKTVYDRIRENDWLSLDSVWTAPSPSGNPLRFTDGVSVTPKTGYFSGGGSRPLGGNFGSITWWSSSEKISYATDTNAAVPSANFTVNRAYLTSSESLLSGYFYGGYSSTSNVSSIDKLTYSSETSALIPASMLLTTNASFAAGNQTAGYNVGASPASSRVDKLTYSTETYVQIPGATLSQQRQSGSAAGNTTAGYFSGGSNPALPGFNNKTSNMDKITYSNDTAARLPGSNLTEPNDWGSSTSSTNGAYIVIAEQQPAPSQVYTTIMNKLTYSTDTNSLLPGTFTSLARNQATASGDSSSAGYYGGGQSSAPFPTDSYTTMDKITYSTDTSSVVPGAALLVKRQSLTSTSQRDEVAAALEPEAATPTPQTYNGLPVIL